MGGAAASVHIISELFILPLCLLTLSLETPPIKDYVDW
jgi:hypothetical protein